MGKSKAKQEAGAQDSAGAQLAALLKQHQEEIATAWAELVRGSPGSQYLALPPQDVRSQTLWGLRAMAESLETDSRTFLEDYLAGICPAGSEASPDASAATEALLLCKDAAVPIIRETFGPDSSNTWALISELDACLRWMVGRLTKMCTAEMRRQLHDERARVQQLLGMAEAVSSTLELDEVVSRVAEAVVHALGVDACTFKLVDEEQRCTVYLQEPSDWSSRLIESYDSHASGFQEVLATRQPLVGYDVLSDPRFPRDAIRRLGVKSVLAVPLMARGKVVAIAAPYTVHDYRRFTEEEIALAQGMGNVLGLVIQNAQLYEQSKLLTVMEERGRLAREIHDGLAQTLGAMQLKASQLEASVSDQQMDESRDQLSELQDMISRAYRDLREAVLGLRAVVDPAAGLVAALREYLTHYQAQYGLEVRLEAGEDEAVTLDGEAQAQAMRIVQEALSNVRRHAGMDRATVRIERQCAAVRICVVDEGQGFDPSLFGGPDDGRHLGLRSMRERAESVGATFAVESQPGQGTRVVLELALPGERGGA